MSEHKRKQEVFLLEMEKAVNSPESLARIREHANAMCDQDQIEMNEAIETDEVKSLRVQLIVFSSIIVALTLASLFCFVQRDVVLGWQFIEFALVFAVVLILGSILPR